MGDAGTPAKQAAIAVGLGQMLDGENGLIGKSARCWCLERWHGSDQLLGIGVLRRGEHLCAGTMFHHKTMLHHRDTVGDLGHDAKIMGDEENSGSLALLQILDEGEDLGLCGHVQRGCGLIGNEHTGIKGKGHGDHGALALAAGKFMGKGTGGLNRVGDANLFQEALDLGGDGLPRQVCVDGEHLANLVADGAQRVQCGHRFLKDHGDASTAHLPHLRLADGGDIASLKQDLATGD